MSKIAELGCHRGLFSCGMMTNTIVLLCLASGLASHLADKGCTCCGVGQGVCYRGLVNSLIVPITQDFHIFKPVAQTNDD